MERYLREVIGNSLTLNSPSPYSRVYNIVVDKTYVWRFSLAIKFDCLVVGIV